MRILVRVLLVVLVLILGVVAGVWYQSNRALSQHYTVAPETVTPAGDSGALARGRHLTTAIGKCVDCHGENLGGNVMAMGPLGNFTAPNLTPGKGGIADRSDADLLRAIRHGVAPDGRALVFMPSSAFNALSGEDLAALLGYLRSLPPVDTALPPTVIGPIGRLIIARGPENLISAVTVGHDSPIPAAVPAGPTAEYGAYLAQTGGCTACHNPDLKGGRNDGPPGTPPSADLTTASGATKGWTEADFRRALRDGMRPDGRAINPFMPWRLTRLMTDEEIAAVWEYVKTK